jgi:mRNA interferase RelE/StbE
LTGRWTIRLTDTARKSLLAIKDQRIQRVIVERIDELAEEPDKRGRPLFADLAQYRSIRAVGQRYRIIYQIHEDVVTVHVVFVGLRKEGDPHDVYALAQRLLRLGLLEPPRD